MQILHIFLSITNTCIGEADKERVVYRNGAKETDLICVSGDLGAAYMGLQLLEREKAVFQGEKEVQPDLGCALITRDRTELELKAQGGIR